MKDPWPVHLTTPEENRANGWLAEARDADGHLISTISPRGSDESFGMWCREYMPDHTITFFPENLNRRAAA